MSLPKARTPHTGATGPSSAAPPVSSSTNVQVHATGPADQHQSTEANASSNNPRQGNRGTAEGDATGSASTAGVQFDDNVRAGQPSKKKKHRSGKKKRNRRQSFAAPSEDAPGAIERPSPVLERPMMLDPSTRTRSEQERDRQRESFYRMARVASSESLESEALLDHR